MKLSGLLMIALFAVCLFSACSGNTDPAQLSATPKATATATGTATAVTTPANSPTTTPAVDRTHLALGDGKYSATPKIGSLMSCTLTFPANAPGAQAKGAWFNADGTWDKTKKLAVLGKNYHPEAAFSMAIEGETRVLKTNNLPLATIGYTGNFPVAPSDPAYQIDRNPGKPTATDLTYRLPANPAVAEKPTCTSLGAIGLLKDGVVIFNALDAGGRDAGAHEVLDSCAGHPAMTQYHHHDLETCLSDDKDATGHSKLLGYAFDGFGLFGKYGTGGVELTNASLDECHGHTHEIEWDGGRTTMYHYHATAEFPYSIGCFKGTPSVSSGDPHAGG